jgi:hypothetical protein
LTCFEIGEIDLMISTANSVTETLFSSVLKRKYFVLFSENYQRFKKSQNKSA